jgi:hypothetical protein
MSRPVVSNDVREMFSPPKKYWHGYPTKKIGGGNPYSCCVFCEISDPQINGDLFKHASWCEWANNQINLLFDPLTRLDEFATCTDFTITCKNGMIEWQFSLGGEEQSGSAWKPSFAIREMLEEVGLLPPEE